MTKDYAHMTTAPLLLPDLLATCASALDTLKGLHKAAKDSVTAMVARDGKVDAALL